MVASDVPGQLLIWYAFAANLISVVGFIGAVCGRVSLWHLALRSYRLFTAAVLLAAVYLLYLFFTHDFSIKYVFEYSDRSLPLFYLLSAFWAGQEGTYLLWASVSALFGFLIIRHGGVYGRSAMAVYGMVNLFLLTMLVKISPFGLLSFASEDGAGLNPLLQDPWMVIHPPVMFVGYAAAGVPFAITLAALITNDFSGWVRRVFPWQIVTAFMLGAGNILGGYWAYKTLGWGGYWSWDPVENSSFIPWFVALAVVHGLILQARTGALRKTNILLTILVFILVVYGTFLTRSGVLAEFSVHSFVDLGANVFLIGFMGLFVVGSLVLFFRSVRSVGGDAFSYNIYGRDFFLFASLLVLFLFAIVVLFGTSLPVTTSLFTSTPWAANPATYNVLALPFAILYALLLTMAPFAGTRFVPRAWERKLVVSFIAAVIVSIGTNYMLAGPDVTSTVLTVLTVVVVAMYSMRPEMLRKLVPPVTAFVAGVLLCLILNVRQPLYILFLAVVAMSVVANVVRVARMLPRGWRAAGGQVAHFGFGLMLIGVLASSAFATNQHLVLPKNEPVTAYGVELAYLGMEDEITQPHNRLVLGLNREGRQHEAHPELYYSRRLDGLMKKPHIEKSLLFDLYLSPQQIQSADDQMDVWLTKDETRVIGDYHITFDGFVMDDHSTGMEDMKVSARLLVERAGKVDTVLPGMTALSDPTGRSELVDLPARLDAEGELFVAIERINADAKAVAISIPGLTDGRAAETLILDISRKPLINLVWAGTVIILIGCLIAFVRRRAELRS